jgi:hypothetical protein
VDETKSLYAFCNFETGGFLVDNNGGCAAGITKILGPQVQWFLRSGKPHGFINAFRLVNFGSGKLLGANRPTQNVPQNCRGEVNCVITEPQSTPAQLADTTWGGWWTISPARERKKGKDLCNTVGGAVQGVLNNIKPADVAAVIAAAG